MKSCTMLFLLIVVLCAFLSCVDAGPAMASCSKILLAYWRKELIKQGTINGSISDEKLDQLLQQLGKC